MSTQQSLADIRNYYGKVLQSSSDLKTGACCTIDAMPAHLRQILEDVHPQVRERFYGCGSPLPPALDGMTVLDLGCGSGRDAYLLSRLVGEHGRVIGVDMTAEQLQAATTTSDRRGNRGGPGVPLRALAPGLPLFAVALGIGAVLRGGFFRHQRLLGDGDALLD